MKFRPWIPTQRVYVRFAVAFKPIMHTVESRLSQVACEVDVKRMMWNQVFRTRMWPSEHAGVQRQGAYFIAVANAWCGWLGRFRSLQPCALNALICWQPTPDVQFSRAKASKQAIVHLVLLSIIYTRLLRLTKRYKKNSSASKTREMYCLTLHYNCYARSGRCMRMFGAKIQAYTFALLMYVHWRPIGTFVSDRDRNCASMSNGKPLKIEMDSHLCVTSAALRGVRAYSSRDQHVHQWRNRMCGRRCISKSQQHMPINVFISMEQAYTLYLVVRCTAWAAQWHSVNIIRSDVIETIIWATCVGLRPTEVRNEPR